MNTVTRLCFLAMFLFGAIQSQQGFSSLLAVLANVDDDRPTIPVQPNSRPIIRPKPSPLLDLKIGYVWINEKNGQVNALRASLETQGRSVAAFHISPITNQPVRLGTRVPIAIGVPYNPNQLRAILLKLRSSSLKALNLGQFAVITGSGVRTKAYWNGIPVTYVYNKVNDRTLLTDSSVTNEIRLSKQKVR